MTKTTNKEERIKGVVYGSAFGDAWGYVTEFSKHKRAINHGWYPPERLIISDDTQMSLYNAQAMKNILDHLHLSCLSDDEEMQDLARKYFMNFHIAWLFDSRNDRAPGGTCITALTKFVYSSSFIPSYKIPNGLTGLEGLEMKKKSKGCGTIMRAPWLGLYGLDRETVALLSMIQSQTTHAHPSAWVSAAVLSVMISDLIEDSSNADKGMFNLAADALELVIDVSKNLYSIESDFTDGIVEVIREIEKAYEIFPLFRDSSEHDDMNLYFGEGWIAEETLTNGIAAAELFRIKNLNDSDNSDENGAVIFDGYDALRRLVTTSGDSDSLACVGGALIGALSGYEAFNYNIIGNFEKDYEQELTFAVEDILNFNK